MWLRVEGLRAFGLGEPGTMRDHLNELVLAGVKTATAGLLKEEYESEGEALDAVGERQVMLDSSSCAAGVIEVTRVETRTFFDVQWEFAEAEGEGFRDIKHWREAHRSYYEHCGVTVTNDDWVVCVWFRLISGC